MATQKDIAERAGLDVSSVNKILNRRKGAVFKRGTVRLVKAWARKLGYRPRPGSKITLKSILEELFPADRPAGELAALRGVPEWRVRQIFRTIERA